MLECVTSVTILCAVEMCNVIQGNDLKFFFKNRQPECSANLLYGRSTCILCDFPKISHCDSSY